MSNAPENADRRLLLNEALNALEDVQKRYLESERSKTEPIAIIGLGCRFPGGADTPEAFWRLLKEGGDAVREVPSDRWDLKAYFDPNPESPGKMYTRFGGFLDQVDTFDPKFFGISPREAVSLDPQQRLVLEVSWEALERAGLSPLELSGSRTGVFIGIGNNDYFQLQTKNGDPTKIDAYTGSGGGLCFAAGRLSYCLGLQGPSMIIDTACSSSLVAVHLACQSLRLRESDMALAGGVNLMLSPDVFIYLCKIKALAADGQCKAFDAAADGFVRGEGCGVIVLKRLSDALNDRDNILAIIVGSAVNQDGRSSGLTVPNGLAQQALIRSALANAKVEPLHVSYIEAHGTGTLVGDPIEANALGAVLGLGRRKDLPLLIGSVKTNLGHLEAAAGIAGLIKTVLALQHKEIPPNLHFKELNPDISQNDYSIRIPTKWTPWPAERGPRIAGVSSFGLSGTNAHVVLGEAPVPAISVRGIDRPVHLLTLSAKSETALRELAGRFENFLAISGPVHLADMCFTTNVGRSHFEHRLAVLAATSEQLQEELKSVVRGNESAAIVRGKFKGAIPPKAVFLFTGQGSQYSGMGRGLFESEIIFRKAMERCDEVLRPHLDQALLSVIYPEPGAPAPLDETAYTQPALFALQYALVELWRSWGVEPAAVLGHSVGEYVAACIAGVFSLEDGLKLIATRGRLMQELCEKGTMAAISADERRVAVEVESYGNDVSIAALNGPQNTVISGRPEAVGEILKKFHILGIRSKLLTVSHAFHSPLMEPILEAFERKAQEISYSAPQLGLISNLTGKQVENGKVLEASYWRRHVREPVRFFDGMQTLFEQGHKLFLEIGPHPILLGMGRECVQEGSLDWLPSLRKGRGDRQQIMHSLARLYCLGSKINWRELDRDSGHRKVSLPTYPFQRQRYWIDSARNTSLDSTTPSLDHGPKNQTHPLLGRRIDSPFIKDIVIESQISLSSHPFIKDHQAFGMAVFPASAYLEMVWAAAQEAFGPRIPTIEDMNIRQAFVLREDEVRNVQVALALESPQSASFQIASYFKSESEGQANWKVHAAGTIRIEEEAGERAARKGLSLKEAQSWCRQEIPVEAFYQKVQELGLSYGTSFRGLKKLWSGKNQALGQARLPAEIEFEAKLYRIHPALLDACLQVSGAVLPEPTESDPSRSIYMPVEIGSCRIFRAAGLELWSHIVFPADHPPSENSDTLWMDILIFDPSGEPLAELKGLQLKRVDKPKLERSITGKPTDLLYEVQWEPKARPGEGETGPRSWVIFADGGGVGLELAGRLAERNQKSLLVSPGQAFKTTGAGVCVIDPVRPEDYRRLVEEVIPDGETPRIGFIHLWSLDEIPAKTAGAAELEEAQTKGCRSVLYLAQALASAEVRTSMGLWLVTRGAQRTGREAGPNPVAHAPIWGLGRTVGLELPELHCRQVDLDPDGDPKEVEGLRQEISAPNEEDQVAFRAGQRLVARLRHSQTPGRCAEEGRKAPQEQPCQLDTTQRGVLENLILRPYIRRPPGPGEVEIRVHAAGLNFRDVLNMMGMYPGEAGPPGSECAGEVMAVGEGVSEFRVGDAILALADGCFSSYAVTRAEWAVAKPTGMTFEEGASIPIVYLTAYYALHKLAGMKAGDKVLIHAAAGGVGLAAVHLAQRAGAEVFATAGSVEKREFLKSLGVEKVMSSRTLDFAEEILQCTGGQGVDIVLNSLSGEFISKSFSCLSRKGRFLEIGKIGIWDAAKVAQLNKQIEYHVIYLGDLLVEQPGMVRSMLQELVGDILTGRLRPLPRKVFPIKEAVRAFRYMAQAKHIGKIVMTLPLQSEPDLKIIYSDACYLITGGLGGLGLQVARWMVARGARHLVLMGRREPSEGAREILGRMEKDGAEIKVVSCDISNEEQISRMFLEMERSLPELRGVVHCAGVLDDGVLLQQTWDRFEKVMAPKVKGAWNLHGLTKGRSLDFFVLFSSLASLLGSPGQCNYAAANAFLDALAHHRRALGLPALSINWGPWSEVGMAAALSRERQQRLLNSGIDSMEPEKALQILENLLAHQVSPQIGVIPTHWARLTLSPSTSRIPPLIADLVGQEPGIPPGSGKRKFSRANFEEAGPDERRKLLQDYLRGMIAGVLGLKIADLDVDEAVTQLGLDSIMSIELRNQVEQDLGIAVPMVKFLQGPSVVELADILGGEFSRGPDQTATPPADEVPLDTGPAQDPSDPEAAKSLLKKLPELSDDQVSRLLESLHRNQKPKA